MKIRKMTRKDLRSISEIWANAFAPKFIMNKNEIKKEFNKNFQNFREFSFVCEKDKKVIGFVIGSKWDEDIVSLGPMAVVNEERSKGIGSILIKKLEEEVKAAGFSSIILTTRYVGNDKENKKYEASSFYHKLGFREIARSKRKRIMFKKLI